ncbi:hypothetical protein LTR66_000201 [Elasticomyces elasticus]|nr:hypothetical protein LTR66_000201 [Elasticomyces elasticus]
MPATSLEDWETISNVSTTSSDYGVESLASTTSNSTATHRTQSHPRATSHDTRPTSAAAISSTHNPTKADHPDDTIDRSAIVAMELAGRGDAAHTFGDLRATSRAGKRRRIPGAPMHHHEVTADHDRAPMSIDSPQPETSVVGPAEERLHAEAQRATAPRCRPRSRSQKGGKTGSSPARRVPGIGKRSVREDIESDVEGTKSYELDFMVDMADREDVTMIRELLGDPVWAVQLGYGGPVRVGQEQMWDGKTPVQSREDGNEG